MGWEGIGTLIGTISSWWTPEKVKARIRIKLKKLKEEESELLKKPATEKTAARLLAIGRDINKIQNYLSEN